MDKANGHPDPDPSPPTDERIDEVLRANGYQAIRAELVQASNALRGIPLDAIDVAIAYLEGRREEAANKPPEVGDNMDAELWTFRALRAARVDMLAVDKRIVARQELRR